VQKNVSFCFFMLLFYSGLSYGGLYQNPASLTWYLISFFSLLFVFLAYFFANCKQHRFYLILILFFYIASSFWTLIQSPNPICDCFTTVKESSIFFLKGINPYTSRFSQVYPNVIPDYFPHLPLSFIIVAPFTILFQDPRVSIVFFNLIISYIFYSLYTEKSQHDKFLNLFIFCYLFLPRSSYMLEHMYQETAIFLFFMLFFYFFHRKKFFFALMSLSFFFAIKQHLIVLIPFLIKQNKILKNVKANILAFVPAITITLVFFFIDTSAFLRNTIYTFFRGDLAAPVRNSLSVPTFLSVFITGRIPILFSAVLFCFVYLFYVKKRLDFLASTITVLFFLHFFAFYSFFNHYFLVILILYFYIFLLFIKHPILREFTEHENAD